MKILFHHRTVSKDGQDVHIQELTGAFKELGHELIIVGPQQHEAAEFGDGGGFVSKLKQYIPGAVYELMEFGYNIPAFFRLLSATKKFQPDIIYERYNLFFLAGVWVKKITGIPMVLEINSPLAAERTRFGGLKLSSFAYWTERTAWKSAEVALPVTEVLAKDIKAAGVPEKKIEVIHNGINQKNFNKNIDGNKMKKELGLDGKLVIGFTGFIRTWHGLTDVLDIMKELKASHPVHLLVVGDGPARKELEQKARELDMVDDVTIVGIVQRDEVVNYTAAYEIALQPKVVDYASPLKLFEYLALGCAIVAPDQPNIREILDHDKNALLFEPNNPESFRKALIELCKNKGLREKLGKGAVNLIEDKGFKWLNNGERIIEMAEKLTKR